MADLWDEFRDERLEHIKSGKVRLPALLRRGPLSVLHLTPIDARPDQGPYELPHLAWLTDERNLPVLHVGDSTDPPEYNVEGVLRVSTQNCDTVSYVQLFSNGCVEAADVLPQVGLRSSGAYFEGQVLRKVSAYLKVLREMRVPLPVAVALSLLNVGGTKLGVVEEERSPLREQVRAWRESGCRGSFDREDVRLDVTIVEACEDDLRKATKATFDSLWRAAAYPQSPSYDRSGRWIGEPYE